MADFQYKGQGLRNVGSYQVSGTPYITGSVGSLLTGQEARIQFPYVTKSVTVIHSSSADDATEFRVHFNSGAAGFISGSGDIKDLTHHYVTLNSDKDSVTFNVKCKRTTTDEIAAATPIPNDP